MIIEKIKNGKDGLEYITIRALPTEDYIILTLPPNLFTVWVTNNHINIRNRDNEGEFI